MKHRRKAQKVQTAASVLALAVMWGAIGILAVRAFDQEQPISGSEYKQQISVYEDEQPDPVVEQESKLYNVPLDEDLQAHIIRACEWYHIEPSIVFAVIWKESNFNAAAVGDGGDSVGLMQIQEKWHGDRMARLACDDLTDPYQNVSVGIDILANHLYRYTGDPEMALIAYNAGVAGANEHWFSKGRYSSDYSRAVMEKAAELRKGE